MTDSIWYPFCVIASPGSMCQLERVVGGRETFGSSYADALKAVFVSCGIVDFVRR